MYDIFICSNLKADVGNGGYMLICNKCGKTMRRGKFCVECGSELTEFFTVKNTTESPKILECTKCGNKFAKGKFCIYCGMPLKPIAGAAQVAPQTTNDVSASDTKTEAAYVAPPVQNNETKLQCVECGKIHDKGKFCTSCGGALKPVGNVPAATAAPTQPTSAQAPASNIGTSAISTDSSTKLQCTECGKIHERGKFCTSCGGTLKPVGNADAVTVQPSPVQTVPSPAPVPIPAPVQNNTTKLQCVECGKILDKGKFCTSCGGALKPVGSDPVSATAPAQSSPVPTPSSIPMPANIPQPAQPASMATAANGLICPTCGKTFEKGKFCTVCGTTLVPADTAAPSSDQPLHCASCGKVFQAGKFCTVCGGQLVR